MPTYEYRCAQCGKEFEQFQQMADEPLNECPDCGGRVKRLISSGGGLVFKGTGFYATDYKSGSLASSGPKVDSSGTEATSEKTPSEGSNTKSAKQASEE